MKTLLSMPWMCVAALLTLIFCCMILYWVHLEKESWEFGGRQGIWYKIVAMNVVLCVIKIVVIVMKSV